MIRREFLLVEGDAFNASKMRRSRERIQRLGFFRTVEVENIEGSEPDRTVIKTEVEEQSTGELTFGAGFSTDAGPIGTVGLRERNLLGRGQDVRIGLQLAAEATQIDLSFTEPYFLDRNLSAGFDIFRTTTEQDESSFDSERIGGSLRAGYELQRDLRQLWRYTIERRDIRNVENDASIFVRSEEGTTLRSSIGHELNLDTRDSVFDPRRGVNGSLNNDFTGLGGDVTFLKNVLGATFYYPITEGLTGSIRGEVGHMFGIGEDTRVSDRFFLSSRHIRGFEFGGVGPRDRNSGDSLGAKQYYVGSLQLAFPLGLPEEFDIRGRVFTDVGAAWGVDNDNRNVLDESSPRVSVGGGISWNSPLGPLELDLGFAIVEEDFDRTEILSFNFGTSF